MSQLSVSDVFISYARSSEEQAKQVEKALRESGYAVWRDAEIPAHRTYAEVIEERLKAAKAVVVLWSADAARSQWVRAEADAARELGTLVQASVDGTKPPIPFNQIQYANLHGGVGDAEDAAWRKLKGSVEALAGEPSGAEESPKLRRQKRSICVLPFANMSGDPEQEYFSDGISEDITTDLSKVSALEVIARNTAFMFKGQSADLTEVAKKLGVSHVLEGSVRKAGNRVRITAQLIDGCTGSHVWADRYDRDLTDVFAIQDEISQAIVAALKVKLLPQERKAIEDRDTGNVEAYDLYLMARQYWISGNDGDPRRDEIILRLCRKAVEIDPTYARAWALIALTQSIMKFRNDDLPEDGVAAADTALLHDAKLAEPHCVKAAALARQGCHREANEEIAIAVNLDPNSWEVNKEAGYVLYIQGRLQEAAGYFESAAALMESDYRSAGFLVSIYKSLGAAEKAREAALTCLERVEAALTQDRSNGAALAFGVLALTDLGEIEQAREWARRALLVDPDNLIMRYNLACAFASDLADTDTALDVLEPWFAAATPYELKRLAFDDDVEPIRDHERFQRMMEQAITRTGAEI